MVVIVVASVNTRFLCEENYHCATGPNFTVLIRYTQFTSNNDSKVVNYDRRALVRLTFTYIVSYLILLLFNPKTETFKVKLMVKKFQGKVPFQWIERKKKVCCPLQSMNSACAARGQCDQMARLLFYFLSIYNNKFVFKNLIKFIKVCSKVCPNTNGTLSKWPKFYNIMQTWRIFSKYGHTMLATNVDCNFKFSTAKCNFKVVR